VQGGVLAHAKAAESEACWQQEAHKLCATRWAKPWGRKAFAGWLAVSVHLGNSFAAMAVCKWCKLRKLTCDRLGRHCLGGTHPLFREPAAHHRRQHQRRLKHSLRRHTAFVANAAATAAAAAITTASVGALLEPLPLCRLLVLLRCRVRVPPSPTLLLFGAVAALLPVGAFLVMPHVVLLLPADSAQPRQACVQPLQGPVH
jgi:hypothetical protein